METLILKEDVVRRNEVIELLNSRINRRIFVRFSTIFRKLNNGAKKDIRISRGIRKRVRRRFVVRMIGIIIIIIIAQTTILI